MVTQVCKIVFSLSTLKIYEVYNSYKKESLFLISFVFSNDHETSLYSRPYIKINKKKSFGKDSKVANKLLLHGYNRLCIAKLGKFYFNLIHNR